MQSVTETSSVVTFSGCEDPAIVAAPTGAATQQEGTVLNLIVTATGDGLVYQWYKDGTALTNGGNLTGATAATLTLDPLALTDAGTYYCEVSGDCGTPVQSDDYILSVDPVISGRPGPGALGVRIYPNPTAGELNIAFDNTTENLTAVLMDVSGRKVQTWRNLRTTAGTTNTLSLEGVASGLYILELRGEGFRAQQRVAVR